MCWRWETAFGRSCVACGRARAAHSNFQLAADSARPSTQPPADQSIGRSAARNNNKFSPQPQPKQQQQPPDDAASPPLRRNQNSAAKVIAHLRAIDLAQEASNCLFKISINFALVSGHEAGEFITSGRRSRHFAPDLHHELSAPNGCAHCSWPRTLLQIRPFELMAARAPKRRRNRHFCVWPMFAARPSSPLAGQDGTQR